MNEPYCLLLYDMNMNMMVKIKKQDKRILTWFNLIIEMFMLMVEPLDYVLYIRWIHKIQYRCTSIYMSICDYPSATKYLLFLLWIVFFIYKNYKEKSQLN